MPTTTPPSRCEQLGVCQSHAPRCPHCRPADTQASDQADEFAPLPLTGAELWAWRIAIVVTYGASAALVVGALLWLFG